MKVLVLGATGYVGRNLMRAFERAEVDAVGWSSADCDLVAEAILDLSGFDAVINCAGAPDLDRAAVDSAYRSRMWLLNAIAPVRVRRSFRGHFVHVSSAFALFQPSLSHYAESKLFADLLLRSIRPESLLVYPGWLHGGEGSRQLDFVLRNGLSKGLLVDDVKTANPTHVDYFCDAVVHMVVEGTVGRVLVYERVRMTAERFARDVLGIWGKRWGVGIYDDVANRPADWSFDGRLPSLKRCMKIDGGFDVRPHLCEL